MGFGGSIFCPWEYCTDPQSHQITSKASGKGPVAGPGFGAGSPAASSIGHARPYVLEVIVVREDAQDILVSINRRFTMYHPWVLELDFIICSNVLIFKNNSPWLIPSHFEPLERPASKGKSHHHDSGNDPVHWEEVEIVFYLGGRQRYDVFTLLIHTVVF